MNESRTVAGIFVGGKSSRMGRPKGLLTGPDGRPLIERARLVLEAAGLRVLLVGRRPEYAAVDLPQLKDAAPNAGPLAGLVALLEEGAGGRVVALACDMPFVGAPDIEALLAHSGVIAAPRREGRWEPLCAAYDSAHVLPVARRRLESGARSLQGLLEEVGATEVSLEPAHLDDWDSPADITAS